MNLNPYLKDFWRVKKKIKILYGGRMSSKSYDTAGVFLYLASTYKIRILCTRRFQNKIDESVYALLKGIIEKDEYFKSKFTIFKSSIIGVNGSEFIFMGLHRSIEEIVGLHNIKLTWIEEGHTLQQEEWDRIRPTILREDGSMCVIVFNPQYQTDYVYKNFIMKEREDTLLKKINYDNNPFLTDSGKDLIQADKENLEEDLFNHIYLGYPKVDDNEAIIKRSWIEAAVDAHIKLGVEVGGLYKIGYDVADSGDDKCATIKTHGILTYKLEEWKAKADELEQSAERVFKQARKDNSHIIYDEIGVGASVGSTCKRLNLDEKVKIKYSGFNAGSKVLNPDRIYKNSKIKNKDFFSNLKAQAWWDIAERFKTTYNAVTKGHEYNDDEIISISSDLNLLDQLKEELATPHTDEDNLGRVKVESKKDLLKRGIKSPNLADSFIMAYARPKVNPLLSAMMAK